MTTPARWYRDPVPPLDTARLYADLRAWGDSHETALRSLNLALGLTEPQRHVADWNNIHPLDLDGFLRGAGLL